MNAAMRVLQVNTADVRGGAERVALALHLEYLARGVDSHLAVGHLSGDRSGVVGIPNEEARSAWARALARAADSIAGGPHPTGFRRVASRSLLVASDPARYAAIAEGVEDFDYPATAGVLDVAGARPEVLHLHNLHGYYFDMRMLPGLSASQPTILTLHDPWPLTGHCAHPIDCPRWRVGCGECPDLVRYVPIRRDASARDFRIKRAALEASRLHYATPSRWLMRMVEESGVLAADAQARVIPNGVDVAVFSPGDRPAARERLGLPLDRDILVFAANRAATNPYKDYRTLVQALPAIAARCDTSPLLVVVGEGRLPDAALGLEAVSVPFVADPALMADYYRAADIYVHPALADTFPLAVIEAMACGTPVVATGVGGIPEIVAEGATGLLTTPGDVEGLATAVSGLLADDAKRAEFARAGVLRVDEHFTLEAQASAYLAWYAELTAR